MSRKSILKLGLCLFGFSAFLYSSVESVMLRWRFDSNYYRPVIKNLPSPVAHQWNDLIFPSVVCLLFVFYYWVLPLFDLISKRGERYVLNDVVFACFLCLGFFSWHCLLSWS